ELVEMLELFARYSNATREVPMMGELVFRPGEASDRHQRELAELRVKLGAVAKLAAEREEAPQQIGGMSQHAEDIADRSFALLDEAIENFTVVFRQVLAI